MNDAHVVPWQTMTEHLWAPVTEVCAAGQSVP